MVNSNLKNKIFRFIKYWLPVFIWLIIIFAFSNNPTVRASEIHWRDFSVKKSAHVIIYAILSTLIYRALKSNNVEMKKTGYISVFLASFYGITDEFHQSFTPGRDPTFRDIIFDTIGATLAIYFIWKLLPKMSEKVKLWAKKLEII